MKSPLRYQFSEYDCGPTTMLNAVSYLFEREEIPPEIIRNVMLYSLDCSRTGLTALAVRRICRSRASTFQENPFTSGRRASSMMPCTAAVQPLCASFMMSSTTPF